MILCTITLAKFVLESVIYAYVFIIIVKLQGVLGLERGTRHILTGLPSSGLKNVLGRSEPSGHPGMGLPPLLLQASQGRMWNKERKA